MDQLSKGRTLTLTSTMTMTILLLRRSQVGRWTKAWKSVKVELSFHKNDFSSEAKIFLIFALTFHSLSLSGTICTISLLHSGFTQICAIFKKSSQEQYLCTCLISNNLSKHNIQYLYTFLISNIFQNIPINILF